MFQNKDLFILPSESFLCNQRSIFSLWSMECNFIDYRPLFLLFAKTFYIIREIYIPRNEINIVPNCPLPHIPVAKVKTWCQSHSVVLPPACVVLWSPLLSSKLGSQGSNGWNSTQHLKRIEEKGLLLH